MVRKGEPWERPAGGPPDTTVEGTDADLAAAALANPGMRIAFEPAADSDLARALGLGWGPSERVPGSLELPLDAMRVTIDGAEHPAVNMVVLGAPPDRLGIFSPRVAARVTIDGRPVYDGRATTVLVANG